MQLKRATALPCCVHRMGQGPSTTSARRTPDDATLLPSGGMAAGPGKFAFSLPSHAWASPVPSSQLCPIAACMHACAYARRRQPSMGRGRSCWLVPCLGNEQQLRPSHAARRAAPGAHGCARKYMHSHMGCMGTHRGEFQCRSSTLHAPCAPRRRSGPRKLALRQLPQQPERRPWGQRWRQQ